MSLPGSSPPRSSTPLGASGDRWSSLAFWLLAAGIWMLGHGFVGLSHDARLYALQTLAVLEPARYGSDLFLAFGSQDTFSVFARGMAPLAATLGIVEAFGVVGLAGALLWIAAVVLLAWRLAGDRWAARVGILLVVSLPPGYGGLGIFRIGANLATPRVLAEALVLLALGCWFGRGGRDADGAVGGGRMALAGAFLVAALAVHPLMALPGLAVLVVNELLRRRSVGLALGAVVAGAVSLSVGARWILGRGLFQRFDPLWESIVETRSPHLFVSLWDGGDWTSLVFFLALAAGGAWFGSGRARPLAASVGIVAGGGLLANLLAADGLGSVVLTQLQLFRFAWPLHALAPLLFAPVVVAAVRRTSSSWPLALLVFAAVVALTEPAGPGVVVVLVVVPATVFLVGRAAAAEVRVPAPTARLAWLMTALLVGVAVWGELQLARSFGVAGLSTPGALFRWTAPAVCLGVGVASMALLGLRRGRALAPTLALGLVLTLAGVLLLDQRRDVQRALEGAAEAETPLPRLEVARSAWWQGQPLATWLLLDGSSYFSWWQGAGVVFSRETAVEFAERWARLEPVAETPVSLPREDWARLHPDLPVPGRDWATVLSEACRTVPALAVVALRGPIGAEPLVRWPEKDTEGARLIDGEPWEVHSCLELAGGR